MDEAPLHAAVARVLAEHAGDRLLDVLCEDLSGADLTAVLLEVMARRAAAMSPTDVLDRYQRDRFVRPANLDPRRLLDVESVALDVVGERFRPVTTSPLVPIGTHAAVAGVHQNRVVTTVRGSEVAADPTNSLALEAAVRRRALVADTARSSEVVRLAAVSRVVRAQIFDGPRSFSHFSLLGLVSAGRDVGNLTFERDAVADHACQLAAVCRRSGFAAVSVQLTDFGGRHGRVLDAVADRIAEAGISVAMSPERTAARGYYPNVCFKLTVSHRGEVLELGDGGMVDWTQALVASKKERLMISGLSLERIAVAMSEV